ncbi:hypothetical protein DOY81_014627 [Sarcophaga bullata]|nr:hypothetical protein DOY81_014627 [Sarcophaga bullata]
MQRPRRTSEFHDDGIRRQSRAQQRSSAAPSPSGALLTVPVLQTGTTAKKYCTRQSRIAVPTRASSSERGGGSVNPYLCVPPPQRGFTPQKTPLSKPNLNRMVVLALIFCQTWPRQMSIKQFVAIINYFLSYIWGTRYTVGTNYVENIINILQKLHYPHPINKSWLKTPNTQHSFGNVIVLLDFLMDFVPPSEIENEGFYFGLKEPEELSASRLTEDPYQIPDLEFQKELLKNSEDGFILWDKQKTDEFKNLQMHTCNLLVQKLCGVRDLPALEREIEKMQKILQQLESERPPEDKEMVKIKSKLSNEVKNFRRNIKMLQEKCDINDRDLRELSTRKSSLTKEVETIELELRSLQERLNSQQCSVEQRNEMIADVEQHKQMVAIKERTIKDLESRYDNQQILQSKAIKQLNDKIENFNAHMREIKFSDLLKENLETNASLNESQLELSLRPQQSELDKIIPLLESIKLKAADRIQSNKTQLHQIQENCKQLTYNIDTNLQPTLNALRTAHTSNVASLQKQLLSIQKQEECKMRETIQNPLKNL